jgi:hypothetical protein
MKGAAVTLAPHTPEQPHPSHDLRGPRLHTLFESQPVPGGSQVQLGYDPLGRLAWTTGSRNFTRFLYDGDALVAEYDYAGTTMIKRYAHWAGEPAPAEAGVPLVSYEGASLAKAMGRWLFADHQGSIIAAHGSSPR